MLSTRKVFRVSLSSIGVEPAFQAAGSSDFGDARGARSHVNLEVKIQLRRARRIESYILEDIDDQRERFQCSCCLTVSGVCTKPKKRRLSIDQRVKVLQLDLQTNASDNDAPERHTLIFIATPRTAGHEYSGRCADIAQPTVWLVFGARPRRSNMRLRNHPQGRR